MTEEIITLLSQTNLTDERKIINPWTELAPDIFSLLSKCLSHRNFSSLKLVFPSALGNDTLHGDDEFLKYAMARWEYRGKDINYSYVQKKNRLISLRLTSKCTALFRTDHSFFCANVLYDCRSTLQSLILSDDLGYYEKIPFISQLYFLSHLKELKLALGNLMHDKEETVWSDLTVNIGQLKELENFHLHFASFSRFSHSTSSIFANFCKSLSELTSLRILMLQRTQIGQALSEQKELFQALSKLINLEEMHLIGFHLWGSNAAPFAKMFNQFKKLNRLQITSVNTDQQTWEELSNFAVVPFKKANLKTLIIDEKNRKYDEGAALDRFYRELQAFTEVPTLYLLSHEIQNRNCRRV